MSDETGEGSARRASDFQINDSSSEEEQFGIPVREITEESPYKSENSSSVGAPAPSNGETPAAVEAPQEDLTPQDSVEVVQISQPSHAPRNESSSSSERGTPG